MKSTLLRDLLGLLFCIFILFSCPSTGSTALIFSETLAPLKILSIGSVALILVTGQFWSKYPSYFPGILVCATALATVLSGLPQSYGQASNFMQVTEVALFCAIVYLSHSISLWLFHITHELGPAIMSSSRRRPVTVMDHLDSTRKIFYETRRSEQPLTLILIDIPKTPDPTSLKTLEEQIFREMARNYLASRLREHVLDYIIAGLRRSDIVATCAEYKSRLLLICPSANIDGSKALIQRIANSVLREIDYPVHLGTASFPADGLTFEGLLEVAETTLTDINSDDAAAIILGNTKPAAQSENKEGQAA